MIYNSLYLKSFNNSLSQVHVVEHQALLIDCLSVFLIYLWRIKADLESALLWSLSIPLIDHGNADQDLLLTVLREKTKLQLSTRCALIPTSSFRQREKLTAVQWLAAWNSLMSSANLNRHSESRLQ